MRICLRLLVCFLLVVCHDEVASSSMEELSGGGGVGELIFDITWPGKMTDQTQTHSLSPEADTQQQSDLKSSKDQLQEADPSIQLLPDGLLPESYDSDPVVFTTSANEKYRCVLPEAAELGEQMKNQGSANDDEDQRPEILLGMLSGKCTRLLMGYWTYELCHEEFVRQFHEEKQSSEQSKLDEYFLGREDFTDSKNKKSSSKPSQPDSSSKTASNAKIPVWQYNGKDYPYYSTEMEGGTPCELMNGESRSIKIKFICDMEAHHTGSFLHIEEVQTCRYEAVISTTQLCHNPAYRLKETPAHTIQCYAEDDSPKRPTILSEHELASAKFHPLGGTSSKKTQGSMKDMGRGEEGGFRDSQRDLDQFRKGVQNDEQFARNFLSGETCLRGGSSGWWQHEVCYGKFVRQIHEDPGGYRQEVYLGYWDEEAHKTWFKKSSKRKRSKGHVFHLYQGGDICDMTRQPRQCQVKLKCGKHPSSTHISLFLEEPTTCNYVLTLESGFLCPFITNADENGLISLDDTLSDTKNIEKEDGSIEDMKKNDETLQNSMEETGLAGKSNLEKDSTQSSPSTESSQTGKTGNTGSSQSEELGPTDKMEKRTENRLTNNDSEDRSRSLENGEAGYGDGGLKRDGKSLTNEGDQQDDENKLRD